MAAGELITDLLILEYEVKYFTQWLILYLQIDFMFDDNFLAIDKEYPVEFSIRLTNSFSVAFRSVSESRASAFCAYI